MSIYCTLKIIQSFFIPQISLRLLYLHILITLLNYIYLNIIPVLIIYFSLTFALSLSLMRENEHSPALMTTIMRSIPFTGACSRINDNDNARMRMLNIHVHVPALMTTIMRHKLINECTRPTQHININDMLMT